MDFVGADRGGTERLRARELPSEPRKRRREGMLRSSRVENSGCVCGFRYQERPGRLEYYCYWLTTMLTQRGSGRAKENLRAFDLHPGPQPPLLRTYVDRLDVKAAARNASRAAQEQSLTMRCKQTWTEGRVRQESQCEKNPRAKMNRWMLT